MEEGWGWKEIGATAAATVVGSEGTQRVEMVRVGLVQYWWWWVPFVELVSVLVSVLVLVSVEEVDLRSRRRLTSQRPSDRRQASA